MRGGPIGVVYRPGFTVDEPPPRRRPRWVIAAVPLGLAAVGLAIALPFAPVQVTDPVVTWPSDPARTRSSVVMFMPYVPLLLEVRIPCAALRAGGGGDQWVSVFNTYPNTWVGGRRGMVVTARSSEFRVTSNGRQVYAGAIPAGDCTVRLGASPGSTTVSNDATVLAERELDPPRVVALATDLSMDDAMGMQAVVHADARFESSPSTLKLVLLGLYVAAALACLGVLWAVDRSRPRAAATHERARRWRPTLADLFFVVVLVVWAVIGPFTDDDGWYHTASGGSVDTGFVGNYYRWFNAPEAPFALMWQVLAPWAHAHSALLLVRLPSVLAVLAIWVVITRWVLPGLLGRPLRAAERWLAAIAVPGGLIFHIGFRPEVWVALAVVVVFGLLDYVVRRERLLPLGVAIIVAGLAFAVASIGLAALGPFVAYARPLWRLVARSPLSWRAALPLAGCGGAVLAAVLADNSLGAVLEATRIHDAFGPALPWTEEIFRYGGLFSFSNFARRMPVVLSAAAVGLVVLARVLRARHGDDRPRPVDAAGRAAVALVAGFASLLLTPSKWPHHFGALTALGAVVIVLAVADLPATLRARRLSGAATAVVAGVLAVAVGLAFARPNIWFAYSQFGVGRELPPLLSQPVLWLAIAGVMASTPVVRRRASGWATVPSRAVAAVVVIGLMSSLAWSVGTFSLAAYRLRDSWSMAKSTLGGRTDCAMGDYAQTLTVTDLAPDGDAAPPVGSGFRLGGGFSSPPPLTDAAKDAPVWGTLGDGFGPGVEWFTGDYVSPWFDLPVLDGRTDVSIFASGRLDEGNELVVELADRDGRVLSRRQLRDDAVPTAWRSFVAADNVVAPSAAARVRLRFTDGTVGQDGWLAATGPLLRRGTTVAEAVGSATALVDWTIAASFPCIRRAKLAHGLIEAPQYAVATAEVGGLLPRFDIYGGTFVPLVEAAVVTNQPSRVEGMPEWVQERGDTWGTLGVVRYAYPTDGYRVEIRKRSMSGWDWGFEQPVPPADRSDA